MEKMGHDFGCMLVVNV